MNFPKPTPHAFDSINGSRTYVSQKPGNFGNTYRQIGPLSILKSNATQKTIDQALTAKRAKDAAARAEERQMRKRLHN